MRVNLFFLVFTFFMMFLLFLCFVYNAYHFIFLLYIISYFFTFVNPLFYKNIKKKYFSEKKTAPATVKNGLLQKNTAGRFQYRSGGR